MSLTINTKVYTANEFAGNSVGHIGPNHTASVKDTVKILRTPAKPTAKFSGVVRGELRATRTLTLTGALTPVADAVWPIGWSVPVGAAAADVDTMCADLGAYIASAEFKNIVKKALITV